MERDKKIVKVKRIKIEGEYLDELKDFYVSRKGNIYNIVTNKKMPLFVLNGYYMVKLPVDNMYSVNRLVAMAFIPTDDYSKVVDHINGDTLDNRMENLQWLTQKENVERSEIDMSHPRGVIQKSLDGEVIREFSSVTEAGKAIGVTRYAISKACLKVNKTCHGFIFDYKNSEEYSHKDVDISIGRRFPNYENYVVFRDGSIYNEQRKCFMTPIGTASGRVYVTLCKNGNKQNKYVNQIVAIVYIPNPLGKKKAININGIKDDNRVENLKWA
jgi:HNH endonuclease